MCERSGKILLSFVLIGLGVMNFSYTSPILQKTLKYYSLTVPAIAELHLNVVLGLLMFFTAVSILMGRKCSNCLIQLVVVFNIALQGIPYVPSLDQGEKMGAMASLMKCVGLFGASLLMSN